MFGAQPQVAVADKKSGEMDFATTFQQQSQYLLPIMIGVFAFTYPLWVSLYLSTFTIFGIIQQYQIQGLGGLEPIVKRFLKERA